MKSELRTKLKTDWVDGENRIVLTEPLVYFDAKLEKEFTAPEGFYSDGASIPRPLWALVGHPFNKRVREAAVIHDYLYYSGLCSRADADRILKEIMEQLGAHPIGAYTYWAGVRVGGWKPWNKYRKRNHFAEVAESV